MKFTEVQIKRGSLLFSIALFIVSLTQKCYCTTSTCGDSLAVFLVGIIGFIFGGAALSWLANPLLLASWIFLKRNQKISLALAILSSLFALSFLFFDTVLDDEAGNYKKIISYQAGYWLWTGSTIVMVAGNLLLRLRNNAGVTKLK